MLTGILVFLGLQIGFIPILWIVCFPLLIFERIIQWGRNSDEEWRSLGIDCPGERLPGVSLFFGFLTQTISDGILYYLCLLILRKYNIYSSFIPFAFYAIGSLINHSQRIIRFTNNTGQPKEIGYFCGTIIAFLIFLFLRSNFV